MVQSDTDGAVVGDVVLVERRAGPLRQRRKAAASSARPSRAAVSATSDADRYRQAVATTPRSALAFHGLVRRARPGRASRRTGTTCPTGRRGTAASRPGVRGPPSSRTAAPAPPGRRTPRRASTAPRRPRRSRPRCCPAPGSPRARAGASGRRGRRTAPCRRGARCSRGQVHAASRPERSRRRTGTPRTARTPRCHRSSRAVRCAAGSRWAHRGSSPWCPTRRCGAAG